MGGFWYDAATDRYYRLDREHRAAARAAAAAARARESHARAARPCAAPLRATAPAALLAAQLAPRTPAHAALRACAVRTCCTTHATPVPILPGGTRPLARRTFRAPLVALSPARPVAAAWRAGAARALVHSYATGCTRPLLTAGTPGDVLELADADAATGAVIVAVDDRAHRVLAVERHALGTGTGTGAGEAVLGARCAYGGGGQCFYDAQWHPRSSGDTRFLALAGTHGRVCLLHAARGELSLVAAPPPPTPQGRRQGRGRWGRGCGASDVTAVAWAAGVHGLYCGLRTGAVRHCDVRQPARANGAGAVLADVRSAVAGLWPAAAALGDTGVLAAGADGRVALYDTRGTGPPATPLVPYARAVRDSDYHAPAVALASAGAAVAALAPDGTLRLWLLRSGREVARLPMPMPTGAGAGGTGTDGGGARLTVFRDDVLLGCRADGSCAAWHVPAGL